MNAEALTLNRLQSLSIDELKSALSELTGKPPPRMSGREFLTMAVAWYLQARQFGGLSPAVRRKLETLRQAYAEGRKSRLLNPSVRFQPGTTIVKEWRGAAYSVTVLTDGFEHDGRKFRSLSEVAREITGTRWNGPAFFGIRKSKPDMERGNG
jgi:hypothetical protein